MKKDDFKKYLGWDIYTWGVGLQYIIDKLNSDFHISSSQKALELGGNLGGLSVCLVNELKINTVCSDVVLPEENVLRVHPEMSKNPLLSFDIVDGSDIKYADNSFDIVIFKSVLGYVDDSRQHGPGRSEMHQQEFVDEIYRILKPGGALCFLENSKASFLHSYARRKFVSWGKEWRYIKYDEMKKYLSKFSSVDMHSNGFFSAFIKRDRIKYLAYLFDNIIKLFILPRHRYVIYGIATK